jgi:hypothetical protein
MSLVPVAMALAWFAGTGFAPAPPATPAPSPGFAPAPPATTDPNAGAATTVTPAPVTTPAATTVTPTPTPTPTPTVGPAPLPAGAQPPPLPDENELPLAPPPHSHPSVPPPPHRYGDPGSTELALALGYTKQTGFFGGGGYRRFIISGLAPGIEASVQRSDGQPTTGLVLASLKLVPARGEMAALIITGRAGRAFMAQHDDGWAAGGSLGVIVFLSPGVGLEIGYSILWLLPDRFCADLVSCRIEGPELGLRVVF